MSLALGERLPPHDPASLARQILAEPRFRVLVQAPRPRTLWDVVRQWIADRWNQLLDAFAHRVHFAGKWSIATGDVLVALIIALVLFIALRLLLTMAREPAEESGIRTRGLPVHADAGELRAAAAAAAQAGAYAAAIALLFQAALALLDARGLLRDDPARTVNECRSDVRKRAAKLAAPFDRIARIFTAAVYAEAPMSGAHWVQAQDAYSALAAMQSDAA